MGYSASSIPVPADWQTFERHSRILFAEILKDPQTQNNGTSGQRQNGVDIYGRRNGDNTKWVGIQCKGKDSNYGKKVTEKELRKEIEETLEFTPQLSEFYLITTAKDDVKIQAVARTITEERTKAGKPLSVAVWGWGTLETEISNSPRAYKVFHPDSTPFTDQILDGIDVQVVVDKSQAKAKYTSATFLANVGIPTRVDYKYAIMHNKFIIIDDSTTELGSFNYTSAAEKKNAENVMVIRGNKEVASRYMQEWSRLWSESETYQPRY